MTTTLMHGAGASTVSLPMPHKDLLLTLFTSTYDNFIQFADLKDGASHCAKLLTTMYNYLHSDAQDPDVIIKIDIINAFNALQYDSAKWTPGKWKPS